MKGIQPRRFFRCIKDCSYKCVIAMNTKYNKPVKCPLVPYSADDYPVLFEEINILQASKIIIEDVCNKVIENRV